VKVGVGSVVVRPVPDNCTVVGVPGRVVRTRGENGVLEHGKLPDPEGQALEELARRVSELEALVRQLARERGEFSRQQARDGHASIEEFTSLRGRSSVG
jgi:serine O-acetyltransferase